MTPLLEVRDVEVAFEGLHALAGVSLDVEEGSIVGLIGPNGAGKTTLFNVISGLQRADAGSIRLDGDEVTPLPANRRAALGMGRSFQNLGLMRSETVRTNLMAAQFLAASYGGWEVMVRPWRWWAGERALKRRAEEVAQAFGIAERLERRVEDLSFGQSRFVELACVFAQRPRLVLLDEPTTGLDLRATARLHRALADLRQRGETVLLVAHNVRFVMDLCDRVYVLSSGRILTEGPPAVVQKDPAVARVYLGGASVGS